MIFRWLILMLVFTGSSAFGQNECIPITRSDKYYSASATSTVEAEARANARSLLIEQISTTISSRTDLSTTEATGAAQSSFYNLTKSVSQLYLTGIQYATCMRDKRNGITVMAYISKEDLMKSHENVSQETRNYLQLMEEKKNIGVDHLSEAYSAYLHTFLTPFPIAFSSGTIKTNDVRIFLENFFVTTLSKVKVQCAGVQENKEFPEQLVLVLTIDGFSDSGMKFQLDCPEFNARCEINNLAGNLNVLMNPVGLTHTFKGTLAIKPTTVTNELLEVERVVNISREIEIATDMSPVVSFDFSIVDKGDDVQLIPQTQHLSIRKFDWTSAGRLLSTDQRPVLSRKEIGSEVTLTINSNEKLSITKKVVATGSSFTTKIDEVQKLPEPTKNNDVVLTGIAGEFNSIETFSRLQQSLAAYKQNGKVAYGKKTDFIRPANCWVFLVDPASKQVLHFLTPEGSGGRTDVKTGKKYVDFETTLKGLAAVWTEIY